MDRADFLQKAWKIYTGCYDLIDFKSSDYSKEDNSFEVFTTAESDDIVSAERAILFECHKKIIRVKNLLDKPPVVQEESVHQSIYDAINSLVFLAVYLDNKNV